LKVKYAALASYYLKILERWIGSWVRHEGGFMAKYRLKADVLAVLHTPGGQRESVMIPAGAMLDDSSRHSATLEGKVGVYSDGRHYSISLKDLLTKAVATHAATSRG
jgi:hypothetical protein